MDATTPALDVLRVLLLSLLLVVGGVGAASPVGTTGAAGVDEVVATGSAPATVGVRRRQLARRFDAFRRRRHQGGTARLRPVAGRATRGRALPASVRGPPAR